MIGVEACLHVVSMNSMDFCQMLEDLRPVILGQCKRVHAACGADLCEPSDLVQAAHLRLWEQRHKLTSRRDLRAYVGRIAHNAALNCLRSQRRAYFPTIDLSRDAA